MNKKNISIVGLLILSVYFSCKGKHYESDDTINDIKGVTTDIIVHDSIAIAELCNPNKDTIHMWENGFFLNKHKSQRDYKSLIHYFCNKDTLTVKDIEIIYPTSVDEMSFFFKALSNKGSSISNKMNDIDRLMTLYADIDTLSCLTKFLNMFFLMDPHVIDRDWMGDWNLNRVMYTVIPDNKESFILYYNNLDLEKKWIVKDWLYAYQNF